MLINKGFWAVRRIFTADGEKNVKNEHFCSVGFYGFFICPQRKNADAAGPEK